MSSEPQEFPLLSKINCPDDLKKLERHQLNSLADELRAFMIQTISKTGGHLASSLGTVELTVALHYVFDAPNDLLVWDVGHQAYGHKILTGRRDQFHTLRLGESLDSFNAAVISFLDQARAVFLQQSGDPVAAQQLAEQALENLRQQQASALAYFDVFLVLAVVTLVLAPVVLLMKRSVAAKGAHIGHE